MKDFDISNFKKLSLVSSELLRLQDNRIFAIEGDLGSGKTTLVKHFVFNSMLLTLSQVLHSYSQ